MRGLISRTASASRWNGARVLGHADSKRKSADPISDSEDVPVAVMENDGALVPIERLERETLGGPAWGHAPCRAPFRRFDANHVRPEVAEQHGTEFPALVGEVEHAVGL